MANARICRQGSICFCMCGSMEWTERTERTID